METGSNPQKGAKQNQMEREQIHKSNKKTGWKSFFSLGEVGGYFFRKKDPSRPSNINIRMMHGINKISITIFLLGMLYLILKRLL